jgi:hypothetical protein
MGVNRMGLAETKKAGGVMHWNLTERRSLETPCEEFFIMSASRDIIPPLGGARVSSYSVRSCTVFMLLPRPVPGSTGTRCHQPRCGA